MYRFVQFFFLRRRRYHSSINSFSHSLVMFLTRYALTNYAISLNLGGTESARGCSIRLRTFRKTKRGKREREKEGEGRKKRKRRELLIRRRARIPCRYISNAVIIAKRSLVEARTRGDREHSKREREGGTEKEKRGEGVRARLIRGLH